MALTAVTGAVDAASFLGLGEVFTANMTGNITLLGFAVAGAEGLTAGGHLVSLGAFVLGAVVGGRLLVRAERYPRAQWMVAMSGLSALLILGAAGLAIGLSETSASLGEQIPIIAALALAMGMRNAAVHDLHVADLSVSVVTTTLTGLVTDSAAAGHESVRPVRRAAAVVAMFVGAVVGAVLTIHVGVSWALVAAAAAGPLIAVAYSRHPAVRGASKQTPPPT